MTIKEKIAQMVQQYSITKDNPTVLRELYKLSAIVELLTDEVDDLESKLNVLDPEEVKKLISDMQTEVDAANTNAQKAIDEINATNMRIGIVDDKIAELETNIQNIQNSINGIEASLESKQNKLTFDDTPTEGSDNPVTSDGIYKALHDVSIALDDTVTEDSENGVKSSGIYTAIHTVKEDLQNEINVTSASVSAQAIQIVNLKNDLGVTTTSVSNHEIRISELKNQQDTQQGDIEEAIVDIAALDADKQNKLTFDDAPTENSENPVTSGGVFTALETAKSELNTSISEADEKATLAQSTADGKMDKISVDKSVTENSENLVTSGAVFAAVGTLADELANKQDTLFADELPISSDLITDLSTEPVDGTMATALAIYKAINNGESGGFKSAQMMRLYKQIDLSGTVAEITLPDNFVAITVNIPIADSGNNEITSFDLPYHVGTTGILYQFSSSFTPAIYGTTLVGFQQAGNNIIIANGRNFNLYKVYVDTEGGEDGFSFKFVSHSQITEAYVYGIQFS